jgi:hypothetical protein
VYTLLLAYITFNPNAVISTRLSNATITLENRQNNGILSKISEFSIEVSITGVDNNNVGIYS